MALIGTISINMRTNVGPLAKGLKTSSAMVANFATQIESTGLRLKTLFAAAATGTIATSLYKGVTAASSLSDAITASKATFGDASSIIIGEADKMAAAFGTSKRAWIDSATTFGSMFQGAGMAADKSAELGNKLAHLGTDLGRLKGLKAEEAFTALGAAMRGEFDPAERLGIFLKADAVSAKAVSMGLANTAATASDGAKKLATLALIQEQGAKAAGFAAANQGTFSAQTEALWGRIENLSATIGQKLLPTVTGMVSEFNTGLVALSNMWTDLAGSADWFGTNTVSAMSNATDSTSWLQQGIGYIADGWQSMKLAGLACMTGLFKASSWLYDKLGKLAEGIEWVAKQFGYATTAASDFFRNASQFAADDADKMWKKLGEAANEPWAHKTVNKYFTEARKQTKALQKDLSKTPAVAMAPVAAARAAEPSKFASVTALGSKEAANAILRSRYGSGVARGAADQTAKNTGKTNELLQRLIGVTAGRAGNSAGAAIPMLGGFF